MTCILRTRVSAALALALAAAATLCWTEHAAAQAYPARPVKLVLTVPPGGGMDTTARALAARLSQGLGQPVVVENKAGASGLIGTDYVAKAPADGYTLLFMGSSLPMFEASQLVHGRKLPFESGRDFAPVSLLAQAPFVLAVRADSPWRTAAEFVAAARARPGAITYVSSGPGRTDHVAGALFAAAAGLELLHVPYKGLGPALQAIIAGQADVVFGALPAITPHVASGRLKILGVVQGQRVSILPDVPTLAEAVPLPGYEVASWIGVMAPRGTPAPVVQRLNQEIVRLAREPEFARTALRASGLEPVGSTPEQLGAALRFELDKYTRVFRQSPIAVE